MPAKIETLEQAKHVLLLRYITEGDCWIWKGAKLKEGYGLFKLNKLMGEFLAHRISYVLHHIPVPNFKLLCVCHTCDNPSCINPDHLFLGTKADNNKDRSNKNRTRNGRNALTHCFFVYKVPGISYSVVPFFSYQLVCTYSPNYPV